MGRLPLPQPYTTDHELLVAVVRLLEEQNRMLAELPEQLAAAVVARVGPGVESVAGLREPAAGSAPAPSSQPSGDGFGEPSPEGLGEGLPEGFVEPIPEPSEPDPDPNPKPAPQPGMEPPPRAGRGSSVTAWRTYAQHLGLQIPDQASRDQIITWVDQHQQQQQ